MSKYTCPKCLKSFSQKSHFDAHNKRKTSCHNERIDELIDSIVEKKVKQKLTEVLLTDQLPIKDIGSRDEDKPVSLSDTNVLYTEKNDDKNGETSCRESRKVLTYIDLFAGIGGFRVGIQNYEKNHPEYKFKCIKSADIKSMALKTYNHNFSEKNTTCDVRTIKNLPYFDILCAGFPCQPFSSAGKKEGLDDKGRGDLIYEVIRICKESKPKFLILENVSNIETMQKGEVLKKIINEFESIGYHVSFSTINSSQVGLAQDRKRIFIIGCLSKKINITIRKHPSVTMKDIIDYHDQTETLPNDFVKKLIVLPKEELVGKSIKDKRGGDSNIHSWDIDYHGKISDRQKSLLNRILLERRKKKWAVEKNITWMDGSPLSKSDIRTFIDYDYLEKYLDFLV